MDAQLSPLAQIISKTNLNNPDVFAIFILD